MDINRARRAILARLKAGEISEDQALAELDRPLTPPKRGRPKKKRIFVRGSNGEMVELGSRYRREPSPRELTIGRHYVELVEAGAKPMMAMRRTLKQFSTKRARLEDSSVRRYAGLFKKWRREQAAWLKQRLDEIVSARWDALMKHASIESARERFQQAAEAAQSRFGRDFGIGQKK